MEKKIANFPSKEMLRLHNFYQDKNLFLLDKKNLHSAMELRPYLSKGMPIVFSSNFSYTNKNEASEKIQKIIGANTCVLVRHGNFHLPKEYSFERKQKQLKLQDYLDNHFKQKTNEHHYLGNFELSYEQLKALDIKIPEIYHPKNILTIKLWIGEKGCITPLHCDGSDNFVFQLLGVKKWTLIPPVNFANLYINEKAGYAPADFWCSDVDSGNVDSNLFPKFEYAKKIEIILKPGEALYVPYGWFHYVETIEDSIMINFWTDNRGLTPAIFNHTFRALLFRSMYHFRRYINLIQQKIATLKK